MDINTVIKYVKGLNRYEEPVLKELETKIRGDPEWNIIRLRQTGIDMYKTSDYNRTIQKHKTYLDKSGIIHLVSDSDWLIIGD